MEGFTIFGLFIAACVGVGIISGLVSACMTLCDEETMPWFGWFISVAIAAWFIAIYYFEHTPI